MGCGLSSARGTLSSGMLGQKHIMCPELRQDIHEELGVTLVACSLKGWRKTQEDTSSIVINLGGRKDMLGVGVFDGHSGPEASRYVAANLWNEVTKTAEWADGDVDGALRAAFFAVDENMRTEKVSHGTTAVVAVLTPSYLYVANCGDSRAVLCKGGEAIALSTDHKPSVYTEMARVLRCGGQVMTGEFGGVSRVTAPGAMVAMATSRSLGDFHFKRRYNSEPGEQVVSPAAEVTCQRRTEEDEFLILGTDGVWDVLSNQEVSEMLRASERLQRPSRSSDLATPSSLLENSRGPSWPAARSRHARTAGTVTGAGARPSPAGTRYYSGAEVGAARDSTTEAGTAVTESTFRGRRGSSFSGSRRSSPAFIRLFTPNLVRLITPTSPEPARARRVAIDEVQVDVAESPGQEEGEQEMEERGCASDFSAKPAEAEAEAAAAIADESDAPVSATADNAGGVTAGEGSIAEGGDISGGVLANNGRPADSISRDFIVTEGVSQEARGEKQAPPMSPVAIAQNIAAAAAAAPERNIQGAWEGGGRREMMSRSSSLSDSGSDSGSCSGNGSRSYSQNYSNGDGSSPMDSDSDSYFEGSEFGGGVTAIAAVLALRKKNELGHGDGAGGGGSHGQMAMSAAASVATSPVTTKHASLRRSFGGHTGAEGVSPNSEAKPHPFEGTRKEGDDCDVDGDIVGGTPSPLRSVSTSESISTRLAGPASTIPVVGSNDDARNSDEGSGSRLASAGRRTDGGAVSTTASLTSEGKGAVSAEPGINPGKSPIPTPPSCPTSSAGACQADVTPNSGNTPNPVNLTPFRYTATPGGSSGSAPKTPSLRTTPPVYRSLRTPGVGSMGTPSRRGSSNGGTPNSRGGGRGGGSSSSRVGSLRRGGSGGVGGLFHRNSGGSSLSLSMIAKDSKGVIGAVRGVLDRALQMGSQDNMTLIAVDLRGLLEPSPPPSTSSVQ